MISASQWNALLASRRRNRIVSITERRGPKWRHPWFTTALWNAVKERWEITIKPGFVFNGREADVMAAVDGEDVALTDAPAIPLTSFRAIGGSANVTLDTVAENAPDYFQALGVVDASVITQDMAEQGILAAENGISDPSQERLLKACDVVVYHDRPASVVQWSLGTGLEGTFAQFAVGTKSAAGARDRAYLRISSRFDPFDDPALLDRLAGQLDERTHDAKPVSTIYFLSPPGAANDAEIDQTWQPFIEYHLWWNLRYASRLPVVAAPVENLKIDLAGIGAAAGAQLTVNQLLAQNNDAFAAAAQFLSSRDAAGTFWSV